MFPILEPEPLQQVDRTYVRWRRRRLSYFSGCDYFRLTSHPAVLAAAAEGLNKFGLNVAASRATTGNHQLYLDLEDELAKFFAAEDALLLPDGYMTNLAVAQGLAGNFSHVLVDEHAHPSLLDAAVLLDCPVFRFKHCDAEDLRRALTRSGPGSKPLVLTDGLFSLDGRIAPLRAYLRLLPRDSCVLVDDAHGAGVLGTNGRGTPEHEGVERRRIVQTITLSKAFGSYGGAVLGTPALRKRIFGRSRLFVGSTPLPLPLASAALTALRILSEGKQLRRRLEQKVDYVKSALAESYPSLPSAPSPIVSVLVENAAAAENLSRQLLAKGIYPPLVNYAGGTGKHEYRFRFAISSEHQQEQLDGLIGVLMRRA